MPPVIRDNTWNKHSSLDAGHSALISNQTERFFQLGWWKKSIKNSVKKTQSDIFAVCFHVNWNIIIKSLKWEDFHSLDLSSSSLINWDFFVARGYKEPSQSQRVTVRVSISKLAMEQRRTLLWPWYQRPPGPTAPSSCSMLINYHWHL